MKPLMSSESPLLLRSCAIHRRRPRDQNRHDQNCSGRSRTCVAGPGRVRLASRSSPPDDLFTFGPGAVVENDRMSATSGRGHEVVA
jgi:hypothetical protein